MDKYFFCNLILRCLVKMYFDGEKIKINKSEVSKYLSV